MIGLTTWYNKTECGELSEIAKITVWIVWFFYFGGSAFFMICAWITKKLTSKHDEKNSSDNNLYLQKFGGFKQPYNTLKPLLISQEQIVVFNKTLEVFDLMGLEIVYSNQQEGIIEAVDTSFWYDFKDDIIVRIETLVSGDVKVDARSASRIGKSDFGVNAKRINTLMELLQESLI